MYFHVSTLTVDMDECSWMYDMHVNIALGFRDVMPVAYYVAHQPLAGSLRSKLQNNSCYLHWGCCVCLLPGLLPAGAAAAVEEVPQQLPGTLRYV